MKLFIKQYSDLPYIEFPLKEISKKYNIESIHWENAVATFSFYDKTNNKFIMFPSTNMYYIINHQKDSLNFIQTITYEFI